MIFSKDIEPMCMYCELGMRIIATDDIICKRCGIVAPDYKCKKFVYTPLKRIPPQKVRELPLYTKEDFNLE